MSTLHQVLRALALGAAFASSAAGTVASQELDESIASRVDAVFRRFDGEEHPGMSVAIYRDSEVVYARGFGLASVEYGVPNEPDTVFRIGSTSKQFTAACIALLAVRGELDVESDVRAHIPELHAFDPPVTIRNLVHHTSGIRDYINLASFGGHEVEALTPEGSIEDIARQESLAFPAGERFQYSNSNYLLLGEIVQRTSGMSLAEFARKNLFEPLGMDDTHFHDRHEHVVWNRAFGYSPGRDREFGLDITRLDHVGDGGIFTTVNDLLLWDDSFYTDAIAPGTGFLELMHDVGFTTDGTSTNYGFGLFLGEHRGLRTVSHGGAWVGFRAEVLRFPD
jgi:CubicO group peptidase (beta-lactamase class C family)